MGNMINKPKPSTDPTQILIELAIAVDHPRFHLNFRASLKIPQFFFKREYGYRWNPLSHADEMEQPLQEGLQPGNRNVQGESISLAPKSRNLFSDVHGFSSPILEVNSATHNLSILSEEEDPGSLRSAKNICRVCFDNMKGSSLIATVLNAKEFVLNTFKKNTESGVLKCKDIFRVLFNYMMCKRDSDAENVKLPTSSFISTFPNAANTSSVNQSECSSYSITVYDRNLRKRIRKRVKIIPFQYRLENYLSADQSEHSSFRVTNSSDSQLESSSVSITVYDRNLGRLVKKRVKKIPFRCLTENSTSENNNSLDDEQNLSADQSVHSPVMGQSISEISGNIKTEEQDTFFTSDDNVTPEVSGAGEPKKLLPNRQERMEKERIKKGAESVQFQFSMNIFSRKNHPSYHACQPSIKYADYSFRQSISENSVNMNKEAQAVFSSSNDNPTPNTSGAEMMPYQSILKNTYSGNNSSFYHAGEASNNLAANSFSQHKDQVLTKAGEDDRWNIVVDASCLLDKYSKRSLELLKSIKGTHLIIPKIVIRELECMKRHEGWFSRTRKASSTLNWITKCMVRSSRWIQVQHSLEIMPTEPTPPASSFPQFPTGPTCSKAFSPSREIVPPTIEDHMLDCVLSFKKQTNNAQFVLLTNNDALQRKAMAENLVKEVLVGEQRTKIRRVAHSDCQLLP